MNSESIARSESNLSFNLKFATKACVSNKILQLQFPRSLQKWISTDASQCPRQIISDHTAALPHWHNDDRNFKLLAEFDEESGANLIVDSLLRLNVELTCS